MKRFGSFKNAAAVAALGGLVASVVVVASAQAAPSRKNYTMQVFVRDDTLSHQTFTVKLTNDKSSNTTLGSANVKPPAGFIFDTNPATAGADQTGWTATVVDNVLQIRSQSSAYALAPGLSMTAFVRVATPTLPSTQCSSATWANPDAKQSNDFNGTNNWFTFLSTGSDLTPLGSFEIKDIGTQIGDVFAPAIYTGQTYTSTAKAYDSCHNLKTTYSGAALTHQGLTNATYSPTGGKTLSWATGDGTGSVDITPAMISETDNTITVTDPTTQIADTSKPFDTQQKICTATDTTDCAWSNGNGINASAPKPATGSLGVGFNPNRTYTCNDGKTGLPLGKTVITIAPHDTPSGAYQVTLVFSKQVSGTGSANAFVFCEDINDGNGFVQLPLCSSLATGVVADCVLDQKRITGGALQVILSLLPGDPYVGGR